MTLMAVKKLSIALDEKIANEAAEAAEEAGLSLSAWISRAADEALSIRRGLIAVDEWEAEHGAPSEELVAEVDAEIERLFGPDPRRS